MVRILCINAAGKGDLHGIRARLLTQQLKAQITHVDLDRAQSRWQTSKEVWTLLKSQPWDLVYQESSGIASGLNLIRAARSWGQRYVISTGDPVGGFFYTTKGPLWGALFELYERLLYQHCTGFIGWTPYLTGMALKMGAKRAITVEGGADLQQFRPLPDEQRARLRAQWGLPPGHLVCGVVGSLKWTARQAYCYGLELIEMLQYLRRTDLSVLIVGSGDGQAILERRIPEALRPRVVFTGRLLPEQVTGALNAMDIGFITQTLDGLGNYRLTTKLPEYLACGLPVAMSPTPGFYDYVLPAGWALPAAHPSSPAYHRQCAQWLDRLSWEEVKLKSSQARPLATTYFDYHKGALRFTAFMEELLSQSPLTDDRV
ncbi:glycosyltransferase [Anthocerotibacter panamensis]|uniref:glycosyltransferase n=1 Tax=Anthocerotibacter panamensis TaxID=2857077 RepID=UPI001C408740|nr:glycosyltransferase [Anthocerotibacter panamensis]